MSTMTLEQISERLRNAPHEEIFSSLIEMADAIDAHLARQSEGVSEEDVEIAAHAISACDQSNLGNPLPMQLCRNHARAALTAVWHNRPAQEKAEPADGVMHARIGCDSDTEWFVELLHCLHTVRTAPTFPTREKAEAYLRGIELWLPTPHAERVRVPDALAENTVIFGDVDDDGYRMGWNACRAVMLSAAPEASSHG